MGAGVGATSDELCVAHDEPITDTPTTVTATTAALAPTTKLRIMKSNSFGLTCDVDRRTAWAAHRQTGRTE